MLRGFRNIRTGEGRDAWTGFACLFAMIGSHAILETARDALFLASIPAARLPWMYIGIAIVSLGVTQVQSRVSSALSGRVALSMWSLVAAAVTIGFWLALPAMGKSGLYALYVWSGVLTSLVLVQFWTLMGNLFSVTQAKRIYGVIGAGSVLGAIAGSAAAGALTRFVEPRHLVLAAGVGFVFAGTVPMLLSNRGDLGVAAKSTERPSLADNFAYVLRSPYAGRVALLLVIAAAALTLGDFVFKTTVAARVAPSELGSYFASVYLVLNSASLVVQLLLVSLILRRFDVTTALGVLPLLMAFGAVGMVAAPGLAAALLIKGADGSLRYSLNRTASELLFVPLSEAARHRIKAFIDVVGQRGGQAVASGAILGLVAFGISLRWIAALLVVVAVAWLWAALGLRRHYLDLFRGRLRGHRLDHEEFPDLDVASLSNLVASLDSQNDDEVIAALEVLEKEDRVRLVPGLILYHPSEQVVLAALDLFTRVGRQGVVDIIDRLLDHESPKIRAGAIAARSVLRPDERMLRMRLSMEESADVRATIMLNLIASGDIVGQDAQDSLDALLRSGQSSSKIALAEAIARRRVLSMTPTLTTLVADLDRDVRLAGVKAMDALRDPESLPVIVDLLGDERVRGAARHCLEHFGQQGFDALCAALDDDDMPRVTRWQIPAALTGFDPQGAADALVARLPAEEDGMVRYRSIRALQRLASAHPDLVLDPKTLETAIRKTVERAYRYLDRQLILAGGASDDESRATPGYGLLAKMLSDKRAHCVDRLFRLLGLRYPREDFASIRRALSSPNKEERVSSVELVENTLPQPLRAAVVGLVDDMPDAERGQQGRPYHKPLGLDYEGLLRHMLDSSSVSVQDLTAFHLGELRLAAVFNERLSEIRAIRPSSDIDRAIELSAGA